MASQACEPAPDVIAEVSSLLDDLPAVRYGGQCVAPHESQKDMELTLMIA